jgi:hypothetical protein
MGPLVPISTAGINPAKGVRLPSNRQVDNSSPVTVQIIAIGRVLSFPMPYRCWFVYEPLRNNQIMKQAEEYNVAIVGGGRACKAVIDMILPRRLKRLRMSILGVADPNPKAVGYCYAQEKGIYTTKDYRDL